MTEDEQIESRIADVAGSVGIDMGHEQRNNVRSRLFINAE